MENILQLIDEQFLDQFDIRRFRALGVDRRAVGLGLPDLLKRGRLHELPLVTDAMRRLRANGAALPAR
jgi:hypothetical protein